MTTTLARDDTVDIPPGVADGFLAVQALELLYLVTNEYDGTDELGIAWDDPLVSIQWPRISSADGRPIVSGRDSTNPPALELVERLRGSGNS